jgi:hypothetical protein
MIAGSDHALGYALAAERSLPRLDSNLRGELRRALALLLWRAGRAAEALPFARDQVLEDPTNHWAIQLATLLAQRSASVEPRQRP